MAKYVFGVDIGGTTVKIGLFTAEGTMVDKWEITTRTDEGGKYILGDIAASIEDKLAEKQIGKSEVKGIGMGVPGPVKADGTVLRCVNLGWGIFNAADELSKIIGLPVKVGNDANMAALGEMWQGGGKGFSNIVMVTLGTGVGGGIIIDSKIIAGYHGAGGEIGHACVNHNEVRPCNCGNHGCLEQYASATGIVRVANDILEESKEDSKMRHVEKLSAKNVLDFYKEGDALAVKTMEKVGDILGSTLAVFACVTDPEAIVIGGGVSKAGKPLTDCIQKYYQKYAFPSCKSTPIILASLGNDAGIYGAARMVIKD